MSNFNSSEVLDTLIDHDNSVYISDRAFVPYKFHPDDVASIMIHEAVHAWAESVALEQQPDANTNSFLRKYKNGMEMQAYDMEERLNGVRTKLSQTRIDVVKARKREYNNGDPSPIILPAGVP